MIVFSGAIQVEMFRWRIMPFYAAAELWGAKVVVDGLVITGQNPASAKGTGEAIVKALKG